MPEYERQYFEDTAKNFEEVLKAILGIENKQGRDAGLTAAMSALSIGYFHAGNQNVLREIDDAFRKRQTKLANERWQLDEIKNIIEQEAQDRLALQPDLKGKAGKIALAIFSKVIKRVSRLEKIPDEWIVADF
jgi:hypothetical protein